METAATDQTAQAQEAARAAPAAAPAGEGLGAPPAGWPGQGFATTAAISFALTSLIAFGPLGPGDGRAAQAPAISARPEPLVPSGPAQEPSQDLPFTPPVNLAPAGPAVEEVGRFQVEAYYPVQPLTVRDRTRLRALPQTGDGIETTGTVEAGGRLMVNGRVEAEGETWYRVRLANRQTAFIRADLTVERQAWQRQQAAARAAAATATTTASTEVAPTGPEPPVLAPEQSPTDPPA